MGEQAHIGGAIGTEPVRDGFAGPGEQAEVFVEVEPGGEASALVVIVTTAARPARSILQLIGCGSFDSGPEG